MANWRQARSMTASCVIAFQKLKPVAEGVPLAGEGMYHDINRGHGELQPHDTLTGTSWPVGRKFRIR